MALVVVLNLDLERLIREEAVKRHGAVLGAIRSDMMNDDSSNDTNHFADKAKDIKVFQ